MARRAHGIEGERRTSGDDHGFGTALDVISTGRGPGDTGPAARVNMHVFDVGPGGKLSNQRLFTDFMVDGITCRPDGARCDVDGNI